MRSDGLDERSRTQRGYPPNLLTHVLIRNVGQKLEVALKIQMSERYGAYVVSM